MVISGQLVFGSLVGAILILAAAHVVGVIPAPSPALEAWTTWIGKVVGILVAARVFLAGAKALENVARGGDRTAVRTGDRTVGNDRES